MRVGRFDASYVAHVQNNFFTITICLQFDLAAGAQHRIQLAIKNPAISGATDHMQPGEQPKSLAVCLVRRINPRAPPSLL